MCGICGELRFDGIWPDIEAIERMSGKLARRGPDHAASSRCTWPRMVRGCALRPACRRCWPAVSLPRDRRKHSALDGYFPVVCADARNGLIQRGISS